MGTHPRPMNSEFIRPLGGWNGKSRTPTPTPAPIQTAQSSRVAARPSSALSPIGVALAAISTKIAPWSIRNRTSHVGTDQRRRWTRLLAENISTAPTTKIPAPARSRPAGAEATSITPATSAHGTAARCMTPRHRGRGSSRDRCTDAETPTSSDGSTPGSPIDSPATMAKIDRLDALLAAAPA